MLDFPVVDLMDQERCYEFLVTTLHPEGLCCTACQKPVAAARVRDRSRAPLVKYTCPCGRGYHAFSGTLWQGTHKSCAQIVSILQGFSQGKTTAQLARELGMDRVHLLVLRHGLQANAEKARPASPLADDVVECDEMYQNAGEKRRSASATR